jgi:hypothetical protein
MEKIIDDVLLDLLQFVGVGVLSLVGYYIYHSATLKKLEKYVLAVEKKSPVLETVIGKVRTDAEKLLDSQEAKDATAQAVATILQKKGLNVTEAEVANAINVLESGTQEVKTAMQPKPAAAQPVAVAATAQKQDFDPAK